MKVTDYDYEVIRLMAYDPMMHGEHGPAPKLSAERRRWDAWWAGTQGNVQQRNRIHGKYTDDQLDTALRKIQREAADNG